MKFRTDPKNDVVEGAFGLSYCTVDSLNLNPLPDGAIDLTVGSNNGTVTSGLTGMIVRLSREQQIELRKMLTKRLANPPKQAKPKGPTILPVNKGGDHRTGGIENLTASEISKILGFKANIQDDPYKVKYSWGFTVDGVRCGVWDYKDSYRYKSFSTFGPHEVLRQLFGDNYTG